MKPSPRTAALKELLHRLKQDQVATSDQTYDILKEAFEIHTNEELVNAIMSMSEDLDRLRWAPYHLNEMKVHLEKIEKMVPEECR